MGGNPLSYVDRDGHAEELPPLQRIHSDKTLDSGSNRYSTDYWRTQPTEKIKESLRPGPNNPDYLKVKPDGRVVDGNTRIRVLTERGVDGNKLPRGAGFTSLGFCSTIAAGAILMLIPANSCDDPCKCGDLCTK